MLAVEKQMGECPARADKEATPQSAVGERVRRRWHPLSPQLGRRVGPDGRYLEDRSVRGEVKSRGVLVWYTHGSSSLVCP